MDVTFPELEPIEPPQENTKLQDNRIQPRNILSGTLPGTTVLRVGDENITVDARNRQIKVSDGTYDRVIIGLDSITSTYGIKIYDSSGILILDLNGTTGVISSADGKLYFDLVNNQIIVNDGSNDRVLIGKF